MRKYTYWLQSGLNRWIMMVMLLGLLSACDNKPCVDADDFGFFKYKVSAKGQNVRGKRANQYSEWEDPNLVVTGAERLVVTVSLFEDSRWTSWYGQSKETIKHFLPVTCRYTGGAAYPNVGNMCPDPTQKYGPIINAPCMFRGGMGAYIMSVNPSQGSPNHNRNTILNPTILGANTYHLGADLTINTAYGAAAALTPKEDKDKIKAKNAPSKTICSSMSCNGTNAAGNDRIMSTGGLNHLPQNVPMAPGAVGKGFEPGSRLYLKILDNFYDDNEGEYRIIFKSGVDRPNPGGIGYVVRFVVSKLENAAETIYKALVVDSHFIDMVYMALVIYIIVMSVGIMFAMFEINKGEIIKRLLKFAFVAAIISPQSWEFFNGTIFVLFREGVRQVGQFVTATAPGDSYRFFDYMLQILGSQEVGIKVLSLLLGQFPMGLAFLIIFYIMFVFLAFAMIKAAMFYCLSVIAVQILIILAPIFFIFILFNFTKDFFDKWVVQMLSYGMQALLVFAGIAFMGEMVLEVLHDLLGFTVCWRTWFTIPLTGIDVKFWFPSNSVFPDYPIGYNPMIAKIWVPEATLDYSVSEFLTPGAQAGSFIYRPAYSWQQLRYVDLPFLEPANANGLNDEERILRIFDGTYVTGGDIFVFCALVYLLFEFNETMPPLAKALAGNAISFANLDMAVSSMWQDMTSTNTFIGKLSGLDKFANKIEYQVNKTIDMTMETVRRSTFGQIATPVHDIIDNLPGLKQYNAFQEAARVGRLERAYGRGGLFKGKIGSLGTKYDAVSNAASTMKDHAFAKGTGGVFGHDAFESKETLDGYTNVNRGVADMQYMAMKGQVSGDPTRLGFTRHELMNRQLTEAFELNEAQSKRLDEGLKRMNANLEGNGKIVGAAMAAGFFINPALGLAVLGGGLGKKGFDYFSEARQTYNDVNALANRGAIGDGSGAVDLGAGGRDDTNPDTYVQNAYDAELARINEHRADMEQAQQREYDAEFERLDSEFKHRLDDEKAAFEERFSQKERELDSSYRELTDKFETEHNLAKDAVNKRYEEMEARLIEEMKTNGIEVSPGEDLIEQLQSQRETFIVQDYRQSGASQDLVTDVSSESMTEEAMHSLRDERVQQPLENPTSDVLGGSVTEEAMQSLRDEGIQLQAEQDAIKAHLYHQYEEELRGMKLTQERDLAVLDEAYQQNTLGAKVHYEQAKETLERIEETDRGEFSEIERTIQAERETELKSLQEKADLQKTMMEKTLAQEMRDLNEHHKKFEESMGDLKKNHGMEYKMLTEQYDQQVAQHYQTYENEVNALEIARHREELAAADSPNPTEAKSVAQEAYNRQLEKIEEKLQHQLNEELHNFENKAIVLEDSFKNDTHFEGPAMKQAKADSEREVKDMYDSAAHPMQGPDANLSGRLSDMEHDRSKEIVDADKQFAQKRDEIKHLHEAKQKEILETPNMTSEKKGAAIKADKQLEREEVAQAKQAFNETISKDSLGYERQHENMQYQRDIDNLEKSKVNEMKELETNRLQHQQEILHDNALDSTQKEQALQQEKHSYETQKEQITSHYKEKVEAVEARHVAEQEHFTAIDKANKDHSSALEKTNEEYVETKAMIEEVHRVEVERIESLDLPQEEKQRHLEAEQTHLNQQLDQVDREYQHELEQRDREYQQTQEKEQKRYAEKTGNTVFTEQEEAAIYHAAHKDLDHIHQQNIKQENTYHEAQMEAREQKLQKDLDRLYGDDSLASDSRAKQEADLINIAAEDARKMEAEHQKRLDDDNTSYQAALGDVSQAMDQGSWQQEALKPLKTEHEKHVREENERYEQEKHQLEDTFEQKKAELVSKADSEHMDKAALDRKMEELEKQTKDKLDAIEKAHQYQTTKENSSYQEQLDSLDTKLKEKRAQLNAMKDAPAIDQPGSKGPGFNRTKDLSRAEKAAVVDQSKQDIKKKAMGADGPDISSADEYKRDRKKSKDQPQQSSPDKKTKPKPKSDKPDNKG